MELRSIIKTQLLTQFLKKREGLIIYLKGLNVNTRQIITLVWKIFYSDNHGKQFLRNFRKKNVVKKILRKCPDF